MAKYINYKVHLSEGQKSNLRKALDGDDIKLKLTHGDLSGEDVLALTMRQVNKIHNAKHKNKGVTIHMSKTQINYNKKIKGGAIPIALAAFMAKAAPIARAILPTLGLSALSGATHTGIQKLLGGGLYLKKGGEVCKVESDGKGLFLYPTHGQGLKSSGDGLYLKSQGKWVDGKGLLLGSNSPLKNIPILGMLF